MLTENKKAAKFSFSGFAVAREGFEPPQTEPKSVVLPLDDRAIASANVRCFAGQKQVGLVKK